MRTCQKAGRDLMGDTHRTASPSPYTVEESGGMNARSGPAPQTLALVGASSSARQRPCSASDGAAVRGENRSPSMTASSRRPHGALLPAGSGMSAPHVKRCPRL